MKQNSGRLPTLVGFRKLTNKELLKILSQLRNIEVAVVPMAVCILQCRIIRASVLPYAFWNDLSSRQQPALSQAKKVVTCCSCRPSVALHKRVNPIESPKCVRWQQRWMGENVPILVYEGKEPIHFIRDILEMGRPMIADVNRLLAIAPAKLSDVRNGRGIQGPKGI